MDKIGSAAKVFQEYGPWAMVVVLLFGIVFLYKHMSKKIDNLNMHYGELLEKRHDQFIQVLDDSSATLEQCKTEIKNSTNVKQQVITSLARIEVILNHKEML